MAAPPRAHEPACADLARGMRPCMAGARIRCGMLAAVRRAVTGALAALLVVVVAAGCTGRSPDPPGAAAASRPHPTTLAGYYAQALAWTPCDKGFRCARLYVPVYYARPAGPEHLLHV